MDIPIPQDRLSISFSRSGGPGGQNVNKVSSKVEIRFSIAQADWIPAQIRDRLVQLFPSRTTTDGEFRVVSSRFRDQHRNLKDCLEKLGELLRAASHRPARRIPTRPTRGSRERRLEAKKERARRKQGRRGFGGKDEY
jgi:ribosome-associated protein